MEQKPFYNTIYRVDGLVDNSMLEDDSRVCKIGRVSKLSYAYYSSYNDEFVFFEKVSNMDKYAVSFPAKEFSTESGANKLLNDLNAKYGRIDIDTDGYGYKMSHLYDKLYYTNENDAKSMALSVINANDLERDNMPTIEELCEMLKKNIKLHNEYDFELAESVSNGIGEKFGKGILCGRSMIIGIEDGFYTIKAAGWHKYWFASQKSFLACLYCFRSGSDSEEGRRWNYSYKID